VGQEYKKKQHKKNGVLLAAIVYGFHDQLRYQEQYYE
jgi:hypothetical protein